MRECSPYGRLKSQSQAPLTSLLVPELAHEAERGTQPAEGSIAELYREGGHAAAAEEEEEDGKGGEEVLHGHSLLWRQEAPTEISPNFPIAGCEPVIS